MLNYYSNKKKEKILLKNSLFVEKENLLWKNNCVFFVEAIERVIECLSLYIRNLKIP